MTFEGNISLATSLFVTECHILCNVQIWLNIFPHDVFGAFKTRISKIMHQISPLYTSKSKLLGQVDVQIPMYSTDTGSFIALAETDLRII